MKTAKLIPIVASVATFIAAGIAIADDVLKVTTISPPAGTTNCSNSNFGYPLSERAAVVRGRPNHKIRIEKNLVDVGLESASISSCNGLCSARITGKGSFDSGRNNHLIDRKGFVELEIDTPSDAPTGNATLVLNYFGGGRGEYKLLIVHNSRVDRVGRTTDGASAERFILTGNNLNRISNRFVASGPSSPVNLTRFSEADLTLVLDRNERNCSAATFNLDLGVENATHCKINDVKLPMTRDATCGGGAAPPPPQPPANPPPPPAPPRVQQPSTPNLLPALATPTVLTRPGSVVVTTRGGMFPVNPFFCSALADNKPATVNVPRLTWGVSGVNIAAATGATARFDVQLIDIDANNRVLDTLTLPLGFPANTPLVQRDNYPGRAGSIRVVMNPRFQEGSAQRTFAGCFTEPGSTQTLDPKNLLIRVDPDNRINEGSNENDNELRF